MLDTGILAVALITAAPISELRGGIPLGLALGLSPALVIGLVIAINIFIFFPIYFGLELMYHKFLSRWRFTRAVIERTHIRGRPYVERFGFAGLILLVAIPLPFTGVWTATIIAWLLGLDWRGSFVVIVAGVLIAAAIVSTAALGIIQIFV
jgi:uncharacterized membrane protein